MIHTLRIVGGVAVVTATADFHPLRQIKMLTSRLTELNFEGLVLFDLLAVNGLAQNRFASMRFSALEFDRTTFSVETPVNSNIKEQQDLAAKNDQSFLLGSVLSSGELKNFLN